MTTPKVYIGIRSGLGNQLFQFAFGYALAKKLNRELVLVPIHYLPPAKKIIKKLLGHETRSFQLEKISLPKLSLTGEKEIQQLSQSEEVITVTEEEFALANVLSEKKHIYLKGYWQNCNSFNEYRQEIQQYIKPNFSLSPYAAAVCEKVVKHALPAIHVRRGDFISNKAFGACSKEYYNNAIEKIKSIKRDNNFLVFSNDINWAKENLNIGKESIFYENKKARNSDIEEMYIMSRSNGLIISNSTFSWWAAWLNDTNEPIIAPEKWFTSPTLESASHLLKMQHWHYLPNDLVFS